MQIRGMKRRNSEIFHGCKPAGPGLLPLFDLRFKRSSAVEKFFIREDFEGKQGSAVGKQGVAIEGRLENMEKPGIAVELRSCAVGKRGFAVERRVPAVGWDLKTVDYFESAVGKRGSAVTKHRFAVGKDGSVEGKTDAAVAEDDGAAENDGGAPGMAGPSAMNLPPSSASTSIRLAEDSSVRVLLQVHFGTAGLEGGKKRSETKEDAGNGRRDGRCSPGWGYARIFLTMWPWTSVRRKSRPWAR